MSELRIMVTGASSGIGACVAEQLAQRGHRVVGAARRTDAIAALPAVIPMALDLADPASIEQATRLVDEKLGPLDVLINCAGYGEFGSIEETPLDDGRRQMEVNTFGAVDLIQRVLPGMRSAGRGRIVNVSSLAGEFAAPLGGWYHASKFALEAISDSLRGEVSQFGIDVTIVQPGYVATDWHEAAMSHLNRASGSGPYAPMVHAMTTYLAGDQVARQTSSVRAVADTVIKAALTGKPRTRYRVGPGASLAVAMATLLPDRIFDRLISNQFGYSRIEAATVAARTDEAGDADPSRTPAARSGVKTEKRGFD